MKNELDVVGDISAKLDALGVPYMLTGSMAMSYYAVPRMTRDIDIVVELDTASVVKLVATLEREYYVSLERARRAVSTRSMFNAIHRESVIKVDCIVRKDTEYRRVEFDRRRRVEIADVRTFIVSKEDLILSKLVWAKDSHSELQLGDVKNLLATGVDAVYLDEWADELSVAALLDEVRGA